METSYFASVFVIFLVIIAVVVTNNILKAPYFTTAFVILLIIVSAIVGDYFSGK